MILHFMLSMLAMGSFALLLGAPKKQLFFCSFTGTLGWMTYETFLKLGSGTVFASLAATFLLTMLSRFFAALRKNPVTIYLVIGILPLVPGSGIYYTSYYFIMNEMHAFATKGMETFQIAGAIAIGILFGFSIPQGFFHKITNF